MQHQPERESPKMADKIVIVRTAGPNFRTVETPAVRLWGMMWIAGNKPEEIMVFDHDYCRFFTRQNLNAWHRARVVAALKRHPECH